MPRRAAPEPVARPCAAPPDPHARRVQVARTAAGAVAVWTGIDGEVRSSVCVADRWGAPCVLTASGSLGTTPGVAALPDGTALAGWVDEETRVVVRRRSPDRVWAPAVVLCDAWTGAAGLRVALDPAGVGRVVWTTNDATVHCHDLPGDGDPTGAHPLSPPEDDAYFPSLAVSGAGTVVAWTRVDAAVFVVVRPAGGSWTAPVLLSAPDRPGLVTATAFTEDGLPAVAWHGEDGHAMVCVRGRDGRWSGLQDLGPAATPPTFDSRAGSVHVAVTATDHHADRLAASS